MTTPETDHDAELRQRIAQELYAAGAPFPEHTDAETLADALLPLVAAERADAVREAADWLTAEYPGPNVDRAVRRAAQRLRARAAATQDGGV